MVKTIKTISTNTLQKTYILNIILKYISAPK